MKKNYTLYHNPRCSKSRQALAILIEHHINPVIVHYLQNPPEATAIALLLSQLDLKAKDIIRCKETLFKELALTNKALTENQWISILARHPILMQRPILTNGYSAIIAREPHTLLEFIS